MCWRLEAAVSGHLLVPCTQQVQYEVKEVWRESGTIGSVPALLNGMQLEWLAVTCPHVLCARNLSTSPYRPGRDGLTT
jgi:hypothetical protein